MPILNIPDCPDINYVRTGPRGGHPILLIHALGLDLGVWDRQFARLGCELDVIAIDLPGHGASGRLEAAPDFAAMAGIVARFIGALEIGPVHLTGISVGGMIAQAVALLHPALASSLTLVATSCTFSEAVRDVIRERARFVRENGMAAVIPRHLERWFPQDFRERRPDVLDRFAKVLAGQHAAFHAAMWEMVATLDFAHRLGDVRCPVLVVAGEDDPSAPPAAGRAIVDRVGDGRLLVLPGCGHFPPLEQAPAFNDALRGFIDQLRP